MHTQEGICPKTTCFSRQNNLRYYRGSGGVSGDKRIVILGDWLQYNSFAVWDGTSLFVDQFIEDEA